MITLDEQIRGLQEIVSIPDERLASHAMYAAILATLRSVKADAHDAMAKDAARYRWLREGRMEFGVQPSTAPDLSRGRYWWKTDYTPEEADAAIDAAMGADHG